MSRPRRLELGLTDVERRERDGQRRTRNRLWLVVLCMCLVGAIEKYFQ